MKKTTHTPLYKEIKERLVKTVKNEDESYEVIPTLVWEPEGTTAYYHFVVTNGTDTLFNLQVSANTVTCGYHLNFKDISSDACCLGDLKSLIRIIEEFNSVSE